MARFAQSPFVIGITATLLAGCATTKMESTKAVEFNPKVTKVYLAVKNSSDSKKNELKKHHVESTIHIDFLDPLTLAGESEIVSKNISVSKNYNSEVVLSIDQKESRFQRTTQTGSTLDLRMYKSSSESPAWRGILNANIGSAFGDLPQKSAIEIVAKLQSDGIIN